LNLSRDPNDLLLAESTLFYLICSYCWRNASHFNCPPPRCQAGME
jgi:hypothetical protein